MIRTEVEPNVDIDIEWNPGDGINTLGIIFYPDSHLTQRINWTFVLDKCKHKLAKLRYRYLSLKGKVTILNAKIISKVIFLASVIKMPTWAWCDKDGKGLKQMILSFLWDNANPQPIKQEIIFLPKEKGGLGLLNLVQQSHALRIKFINQITNNDNTKPWVHMGRYWLRSKLHRYRPEWAWLNQNINTIPRYIAGVVDVTPYNYKQLLKDFDDNSNAIITTKAVTTKEIYMALRIQEDNKTEVFAQHMWDNCPIITMFGPINWKNIWLNMYHSYNVGTTRDVLYKLVHNALPTKVRIAVTENKKLQRARGGRFNTKCSSCTKVDENTLHIFARCKHACNVWQLYQPIYTRLLPGKPYIYEQNALTVNLQHNVDPKVRKLLLTITELIVQELWLTRNKCWKEGIEPSRIRSKNRINRNITKLIRTHYKYHKNRNTIDIFRDNFLMVQALGDLDDHNDLHLHLPP